MTERKELERSYKAAIDALRAQQKILIAPLNLAIDVLYRRLIELEREDADGERATDGE